MKPMDAPRLILVKHASPTVTPGVPPERWPLSDAGRQQCGPLADALAPFAPTAVVTSVEPKAAETGELLAGRLGVPFESAGDLHEHDRSNVPHLPSREFISLVELFFRKPAERVLGRESADEALGRFEKAVAGVVAARPGQTLVIVSHGTVIALLLAARGGGRGYDLWRKMGLPSFAVLDAADGKVSDVVSRVG